MYANAHLVVTILLTVIVIGQYISVVLRERQKLWRFNFSEPCDDVSGIHVSVSKSKIDGVWIEYANGTIHQVNVLPPVQDEATEGK